MENIYNPDNYPNLLDDVQITSSEISNMVSNYIYTKKFLRDLTIENETIPRFIDSFYSFVLTENKIPTQDEYLNNYLKSITEYCNSKNFNTRQIIGVKARASRAYPSLIRDIHFNKYVSEKFKEGTSLYNIKLDTFGGIDLMIEFENNFFGVNLFVNTARSNSFRNKKFNRHEAFSNVHLIEFPTDLPKDDFDGVDFKIHLYGEKEYDNLIYKIKTITSST